MCPQYTFSSTTNRITNSNFTYDSAGDLTQDGTGTGTHTYQYDAEGRLISVDNGSTASYVYNALGERAERKAGGTYTEYLYDQDGSEVGENNRTTWTETWAAFQGRHLFHFSGGSTYFTHMHSLGTTSIVTDYSTGAVVQDELHYPWGQEWAMLGTMQEERFAHLHHRDSETSLDPTQHRMYSSSQARWMTPDPLHGHIGTPQSLNRYAYVLNNPKILIDPRGLDCGSSNAAWWQPCNWSSATVSANSSSLNLQGLVNSANNAAGRLGQFFHGLVQVGTSLAGAVATPGCGVLAAVCFGQSVMVGVSGWANITGDTNTANAADAFSTVSGVGVYAVTGDQSLAQTASTIQGIGETVEALPEEESAGIQLVIELLGHIDFC